MSSPAVVSANGQPLDIKENVGWKYLVSIVHPVLVAADMMHNCLLTIDFLGKYNCTINLNGESNYNWQRGCEPQG